MIERGIYLRPAIDPWIQTRPELKEFALSDREWELAEFLLRFLEPFRHATNSIQATERPSLHKTFVMYEKLYNNLENIKAIFNKMTTVPEWFQEVQNAIDEMWDKFKHHYSKTKKPPAYVDANILHPGKKLHLFKKKDSSFMDTPGQAQIYEQEARARFDKYYNHQKDKSLNSISPVQPSNSLKRKRAEDSDSDSDNSDDDNDTSAYNEFDHYLRVKRDKLVRDALPWWRTSHGMFPKMGLWYRDVGAVPASGAGVEREFSISGNIATKKRPRLRAKTISDTMMYKRWRAHRGNPIPCIADEHEIPDEYDEDESDAESEFDERNIELESWLAEWMAEKELASAAQALFPAEA